ncbi:hypothetical protein [Streptomyces wuyuanensis]|uniref:hypothetical protein n=1 Tax=Streptomyces wuyuanensis TaxID=1196353 RepID=UPI00369EB8F4
MATYLYADDEGVTVAEVGRRRCSVASCAEEAFDITYPNGEPHEGLVLYGTPGLASAIEAGWPIYVCQDEEGADALRASGCTAVCAPPELRAGHRVWRARHADQLRDAHLVVVAADSPSGIRLAQDVAATLHGTAASVRIVSRTEDRPVPDVTTAAGALPHPVPKGAPHQRGLPSHSPHHGSPDDPGLPIVGSPGWRYEAGPAAGTVWKARRGKDKGWDEVLDWAPYVSERLVLLGDDGKSAGRYYTITIGADTLTKSLADLRTADGWNDFSDDTGGASRAIREVLINAITDQGKRLPRTAVVTHTGWHHLPDSGLTYVYADGRTFPPDRRVRLIGAPEPLRRAAEPLPESASDDACGRAVDDIAGHGWAPLMGLAVGARSLAYTLRPVPAAFILDAAPNSGKTSAANTGRSLLLTPRPHAWPPVPTKGMNSTVTDIECAIDFEGDIPLLLDDIPLTRTSSGVEMREMEKKLELIIRAAGNATEIKGRRNRDLTAKPGNRVRAIPVIAAQMLPPTLQESLYRRSVVAYLSRDGEDVDWRWYKETGGRTLTVPLRTIGDRIIAHLHAQEDPDAYLERLEAMALRQFAPYAEARLGQCSGSVDGVVTAAAAMLAGLGLVGAVTDRDMAELIDVVAEPLAASIARQAARMDEQHTAQDGVAVAVGEVLRKSLARRRAHIRDNKGVVRPAVPGCSEQEQGLTRKRTSDEWEGNGPTLYWLPDRGPAVGITTSGLNMLLKESGDPRVNCYSDRALPDALLQAGVIQRNTTQKDRVASHRVRIGPDNLRLVLIKAGVVWES